MKIDESAINQQIEEVLIEWKNWRDNPLNPFDSQFSSAYIFHVYTLFSNLSEIIRKFAPPQSQYYRHANDLIKQVDGETHAYSIDKNIIDQLAGILFALKNNYNKGYLFEMYSLINAEIFSDFLDMAEYFLESNEQYKHPAAFLIGGVLEEHLRKLAIQNDIPIKKEDGKFRRAESLNTDLRNKNIYSLGEQKTITALLDIRNDADHGHWESYSKERVEVMLKDVRRLIKQYPA